MHTANKKNHYLPFTSIILTLLILASSGLAAEPELVIEPGEAELLVGDTVWFEAVYIDTSGTEMDTTVSWSVVPDSLGTITNHGKFTALLPGECIVQGSLDTLEAWSTVIVETDESDDDEEGKPSNLVILPADTVVAVGAQVQFSAFYRSDSSDALLPLDTTINWNLLGMTIGTIDTNGLFTANTPGYGLLQADVDTQHGTSLIIVAGSTVDNSGVNSIEITRSSPNPKGYTTMAALSEGDFWTLAGMPHPLNVLNGGWIYFPFGSINEDIRIHIDIPDFAEISSDSVGWGQSGIVAGVSFTVMLNDTVIKPFHFNTPLVVGLIYKRGLLDNLGIDPNTLSLYYAETVGDSVALDSTGLGLVTVDVVLNRIFSTVPHFSTLAVSGVTGSAASMDDSQARLPEGFTLCPNYPNPFNPVTNISFYLPRTEYIRLTVYNLAGQQVLQLYSGIKPLGQHQIQWNGRNQHGQAVSTGMYLYQIKAGEFVQTRKMLLLK